MFVISIENLKTWNYHIFSKKHSFLLFTVRVVMNIKRKFKEKDSIEILKILGLITNIDEYQKIYNHIIWRKQGFRLKNIDESRNYLIEEINQNELTSKKYTATGCVPISAFASLIDIFIRITSSAVGLKVCVITAGIKKSTSIIKKKNKEHDKIVLLAKSILNRTEVLISNTLIDSVISHAEFVLINNVLKEFSYMKEEI